MSSIYRTIYEQYFGKIPKDSQGRSYEIHHLDGNHENNDISNLRCVSIQEHYDIHYRSEKRRVGKECRSRRLRTP